MTAHRVDAWHRAGWVIQTPHTIIRNGLIHVSGGQITSIKSGKPIGPDPVVDHGPGALMPALINVHTHLELGALKGKIPWVGGFESWVRTLIKKRTALDANALLTGIETGIEELIQSGCGAVGEIATMGASRAPFFSSLLGGVWFKEYLGNTPCEPPMVMDTERTSFAGHAPHTTSPHLLAKLKKLTKCHGQPFSIHLSESPQEDEFIRTGRGSWAELLEERKIDFSTWPIPAKSPVNYLDRLNLLDDRTLAVHLLQADHHDFETLAIRGVSVVVCPRSNQRLHKQYPDILGMVEAGLTICLGTDSLASCDSLSVFDEMASITQNFSKLSPIMILSMATINGADALGIGSDFGHLNPKSRFTAIYVPLSAASPEGLLEGIVNAQFAGKVKWLCDE